MGVDLGKIATSAIEAALDDGANTKPKHKRGSTVKAVAAGAALAVAAKAATSKRTKLMSKLVPTPSLDGLRDIPGRVRDRLADSGWLDNEEDVEPEDAGPLDEVAEEEPLDDEEPVDEDDEDFDEEEEDEPVDEEGDDFDAEEDDEDLDEDEDEDDEDFDEDEDEDSPPELAIDSDDDEDIDPVTRPPKPPKATSRR